MQAEKLGTHFYIYSNQQYFLYIFDKCNTVNAVKSTYDSDSIPVSIQSSIMKRREPLVIPLSILCRVAEQVGNTAITKMENSMKHTL